MTTKNRDSLKGVLKDVEQERRTESAAASKLKVDNRKAFKDLEDKGFNRIIIVPKTVEEEIEFVNAPEVVVLIPKKKTVKAKKLPPKKDPKDEEIEELRKQVEALKIEKEFEFEPIEETE